MRRRIGIAVFAVLLAPASLLAQGGQDPVARCGSTIVVRSGNTTSGADPLTGIVNYFGRGFEVNCPQRGIRIVSDSAVQIERNGQLHLIGNVVFTQEGARVRSRQMIYEKLTEHIRANGDVVATLANGSSLRGPDVDYSPGNRTTGRPETMTARGRPHFVLVDRDTVARSADTTNIDAQTVAMIGDLTHLSGNVIIDRTDFSATGDSVFVDRTKKDSSLMRILKGPQVRGKKEDFTLLGLYIDVHTSARKLNKVVSKVGAKVVSDDVNLDGDTIDLRLEDEELKRAYAWGSKRARAESQDNVIEADSIDIAMLRRKVSEVRAVGKAHVEVVPDSGIVSERKNFIDGDTVTARFVESIRRRAAQAPRDSATAVTRRDTAVAGSAATVDTIARPELLIASGNARAYFQRQEEKSPPACPTITYATGTRITIRLKGEDIDQLHVLSDKGQVQGATVRCPAAGGTRRPGGAARDTIPPR